MNAINRVPAAYRPADLGPNQQRYLERKGWVDRRIVRTIINTHALNLAGRRPTNIKQPI